MKINKTSIKGSRTKIRNKIIGIEVEIPTIKRTNLYFSGRREKKKKRPNGNKSNHHRQEKNVPMLLLAQHRDVFGCGVMLYAPLKRQEHLPRVGECASHVLSFLFFYLVKHQITLKLI